MKVHVSAQKCQMPLLRFRIFAMSFREDDISDKGDAKHPTSSLITINL